MSSDNTVDDCSICLNGLLPGAPLLILSCNHKFHFDCLSSHVKAQNHECPLCRATIDISITELLKGPKKMSLSLPQQTTQPATLVPSVEDLVDEEAARALSTRPMPTQQTTASSSITDTFPRITATTTLEFAGQSSDQESNIYGLVTVQAPSMISVSETEAISSSPFSRVPVDLVCVVDQSGSMKGEKITLLKQTLIYIVDQLNELDRLAIISFNTTAFNYSYGLKRLNQPNKEILKKSINEKIKANGGTFIGCGLSMGIEMFTTRQTKNPVGGLLLLTDGQDNQRQDYSNLMKTLPEDVLCHTFGYGPDHTASLLVQLAEQGNGGTFTYINEEEAVGPAFAMTLGSLFSCIAQQICIKIEFNGEYKVTNIHSKYKYEPEELPSSITTLKLNDLNIEERRNLIFQLYVPKIPDEQSVEIVSEESLSRSEQQERLFIDNHQIGHVSITYLDPSSGLTITTNSVPFELIRVLQPSLELLHVNYTLDLQRNRVETALILKQAMEENNYEQSMNLLKDQTEKLKKSVSAKDPFCQQLIKDLQHRFRSERDYRSTHHNTYMQHLTERGTWSSTANASTTHYSTSSQVLQADHFRNSRTLNLHEKDRNSLELILCKVMRIPEYILGKITVAVLRGLSSWNKGCEKIKPSNILINRLGEINLRDFNSSIPFIDSPISSGCYISPEQLKGECREANSDIWALGLSLVEMAVGRYPIPPPTSEDIDRLFKDDPHGNMPRIKGYGTYQNLSLFEVMEWIVIKASPTLPQTHFSPVFCDFIDRCLKKNATERADLNTLLNHPFYKQHEQENQTEKVVDWIREIFQPDFENKRRDDGGNSST